MSSFLKAYGKTGDEESSDDGGEPEAKVSDLAKKDDSDEEEEDEEPEGVGVDFEEEEEEEGEKGGGGKKAVVTKNEVPPVPEISRLSIDINEEDEIISAGKISSIVAADKTCVVKGDGGSKPLTEGSVLCSADKKPLGKVRTFFRSCVYLKKSIGEKL